jgi:hypothetical protein
MSPLFSEFGRRWHRNNGRGRITGTSRLCSFSSGEGRPARGGPPRGNATRRSSHRRDEPNTGRRRSMRVQSLSIHARCRLLHSSVDCFQAGIIRAPSTSPLSCTTREPTRSRTAGLRPQYAPGSEDATGVDAVLQAGELFPGARGAAPGRTTLLRRTFDVPKSDASYPQWGLMHVTRCLNRGRRPAR